MTIQFSIATIEGSYLRMALAGPSGSGKTLTALKLARHISKAATVVIDTERDTARLYANRSDVPNPFYIFNLKKYKPDSYIKILSEVVESSDPYFDFCIIDSLTPSWNKTDGILDIAGGDIRGWKAATPKYNELVDTITGYNNRMHIIATLRSKPEYKLETSQVTGKLAVTNHGMQPIHRDELPYEFDIVGQLDEDHNLTFNGVGKQRTGELLDGKSFDRPGKELADLLSRWLSGEK